MLYQINTRVMLGRAATLDDIPGAELDRIARLGFEWVWLLGVWQTGEAGRRISLENREWRREFESLLPDFSEQDVCGSCFAIQSYVVHADFGGDAALERLRARIHERGMRLMLDFVPNHTAPDHPWVRAHPEYYVHSAGEPPVMVYGKDPNFPGWPDTLQLDYANPALQEAMCNELEHIASMCDGVRCDMAMLILPEVFERTWGTRPQPFWPAAIGRVRKRNPDFLMMAEVYWDLEYTLQQQGFDFTYDKRLYDRLRAGYARPVREHLGAGMDFQRKSVRFLENHDEPRAAGTFAPGMHEAAAVLAFMCPGLRLFHQGQMEGFTKRIPVHLCRGPEEPVNAELHDFYERLLGCLRHPSTHGEWRLIECRPAWEGNWTADCFIAFEWCAPNHNVLIVAVNYASNQSQCYVQCGEVGDRLVRFRDLMHDVAYDRDGADIRSRGLYLDLPPWGYHVFEAQQV
jgi:hypothetical protein